MDVFQSGRTSICRQPHFEHIIRFSNDFTDKPSGWPSTFTLLECVQEAAHQQASNAVLSHVRQVHRRARVAAGHGLVTADFDAVAGHKLAIPTRTRTQGQQLRLAPIAAARSSQLQM